MDKILWTEAIAQMRQLSKEKTYFSIAHGTYDSSRVTGHGLVRVDQAVLRPSLPNDAFKNVNPDLLLPYKDLATNENRMCYKCLIVEFNGREVVLQ